jgi:hypothetical protein
MFELKNQFGWIGFAYIRDIIRYSDYLLCRMTVFHSGDESEQQDEVWLNCKIEDKALLQLFAQLECDFHIGNAILLQFSAEYIGFESAQFDQDRNYQNHLLNFKAKLVTVESYFVNGHKYVIDSACLRKNAA